MARQVTGGVVQTREELTRYLGDARASLKIAKEAGNKMQMAFEQGRIDAYQHAIALMHQ